MSFSATRRRDWLGLETATSLELSEGMKVKLNLLLALSHRSEVLILDEPTSGLDPFSRNELLEIFENLKNFDWHLPIFDHRIYVYVFQLIIYYHF